MANFLDFSVKTREQLKDYIITRLGAPLIVIELADEQLDLAIDQAIEEYTRYVCYDNEYLGIDLSQYVEGVGIVLPENVASVYRIDDSGFTANGMGIDNLFSIPNQMYNNGDLSFGVNGVMGLVNYDLFKRRIKLLGKLFATGYEFNYQERTRTLKLTPDPAKIHYDGFVVASVRLIRDDSAQYGESWVKRYSLAVAKEMLYYVRSKFDGVQLLGGAKLDNGLRDSAVSQQKELIEELIDIQGPADFSVG